MQYLLKLGLLIMEMETLFLSLLSETQVLGLKKRISLKYSKFLANLKQPQVLTHLELGWDYPLAKRLQRLLMEKYLLLMMKKKFRGRQNSIPIGLKFLLKKRILKIIPNLI